MYHSFSPGKLRSRHTMKQSMGSYYSHDSNTESTKWKSVGSASALAEAVRRTPFFNQSMGRNQRVGPPLFPSASSTALFGKAHQKKELKRRRKKKKAPSRMYHGEKKQTAVKTQMSKRNKSRSLVDNRRRPVQSKSAGDLFDESNLLGRMTTVKSLATVTPSDQDNQLDSFGDYNTAMSLGLDGGW